MKDRLLSNLIGISFLIALSTTCHSSFASENNGLLNSKTSVPNSKQVDLKYEEKTSTSKVRNNASRSITIQGKKVAAPSKKSNLGIMRFQAEKIDLPEHLKGKQLTKADLDSLKVEYFRARNKRNK